MVLLTLYGNQWHIAVTIAFEQLDETLERYKNTNYIGYDIAAL